MAKKVENKLKEGYGTGIGHDYKSFYNANEKGSIGTSGLLYNTNEDRMSSVLSTTEKDLFYILLWNDDVEYIREQYPLDPDLVNEARENLGYSKISKKMRYTTDFFVDMTDGTFHAYSVKWKKEQFDPKSSFYKTHPEKYDQLIRRMRTEKEYWDIQDIPFSIVTSQDIDRKYAENIAYVMGFYFDRYIVQPEQKLMYLIAHKAYLVPLNRGPINPHKLLESFPYNIEEAYDLYRKGEVDFFDVK